MFLLSTPQPHFLAAAVAAPRATIDCLFSDDTGVRISVCKFLDCGISFPKVDFVDRELVLVGVGGKEGWLGLDEYTSW